MSEPSSIFPVEPLVQALRRHAAAMELPDADVTTVVPAISGLRTAALDYVKAVFEHSGWGDVFEDLYEDEDEEDFEDDGDEDDSFEVADGVERLSITGRWDVLVRDPIALRAEVVRRIHEEDPEMSDADIADHVDLPAGAIEFAIGMTEVWGLPGLDEAGSSWSVGPVARTLFEMTTDEREEADGDV